MQKHHRAEKTRVCVQNQINIAVILQMLTVRILRELRKTLIILKNVKYLKKIQAFKLWSWVWLDEWHHPTALKKKTCHVTWMQSQLLRHPERWGMCRRCPSIQNMLWSTDNAFHYRGLGEYLIMFSRPDVPATACAENPKEIFHTILQLCNLFYASRKWRAVLFYEIQPLYFKANLKAVRGYYVYIFTLS